MGIMGLFWHTTIIIVGTHVFQFLLKTPTVIRVGGRFENFKF